MELSYLEIPRAYTAIAEWAACMVYLLFLNRLDKRRFSLYSGAALAIQIAYMVITAQVEVVFWVPCMIGAVSLMYLFLYLCGGLSFWGTGYCCAKAFLLAELMASFQWQLHNWLFRQIPAGWCTRQIFFLLIYAGLFLGACILEKRLMKTDYVAQVREKEVIAVAGIVVIVFAFSNLSFLYTRLPFTSSFPQEIANIRTLVDLGGLATLYAFQSRLGEYHADRELTAIQTMLRTQYDQYRNYQNNVELIHMKYHDLKHQIAGLRGELDGEKRKEWLDAMEQELDKCHQAYHTGNRVLDTLLETKGFLFQNHKIRFTCVVDGALLENLHVVDICSIFGNALDNAIESVALVADEEKRLIHLSVSSVKKFTFIKVENYCENPPEIRDGKFPETSKSDKKNHGYGLKSIRYAVEKNGGTCSLKAEGHWFELQILFPQQIESDRSCQNPGRL